MPRQMRVANPPCVSCPSAAFRSSKPLGFERFQSGAAAGLPAGQPCNPAGLPSWQRSAALAAALLPRRAASRAARPPVQGCQDGSAGLPRIGAGLPCWQHRCHAGLPGRQRRAASRAALKPRRAALLPAAPLCSCRVTFAAPVPSPRVKFGSARVAIAGRRRRPKDERVRCWMSSIALSAT